jgi:hypothetical protein
MEQDLPLLRTLKGAILASYNPGSGECPLKRAEHFLLVDSLQKQEAAGG